MSVATEGELSPTELGTNKEAGCSGDDDQRHKLLPIHGHNLPVSQ
jgi:hypothetical protein